MQTLTINIDGSPKTGIWSGAAPLPEINSRIPVNFGEHTIGTTCSGYFLAKGETNHYIGIKLIPDELPRDMHQYGLANRLRAAIDKNQFAEAASDEKTLEFGIYGAEISQKPLPEKPGISVEEELAALAAVALGGRTWRETLQGAWFNGNWHATPYLILAGPLQRIRNSLGIKFVEKTIEKNAKLTEELTALLKLKKKRC